MTAKVVWGIVLVYIGLFTLCGAVVTWAVNSQGKGDESPVTVNVQPPSTPPGIPVPQRGTPGYPIERWEKLREATK